MATMRCCWCCRRPPDRRRSSVRQSGGRGGRTGAGRPHGDLRHPARPPGNRLRLYRGARAGSRALRGKAFARQGPRVPGLRATFCGIRACSASPPAPCGARWSAIARNCWPAAAACIEQSRVAQGKGVFAKWSWTAQSFGQVPDISIDYAVMEKSGSMAVVPCDIGWSDIGSWTALGDLAAPDANGNRVEGAGLLHDVTNCYVRSGDRMVARSASTT